MPPIRHVHAVHKRLKKLTESEQWAAAAQLASTLPLELCAQTLNGHPYHDLWWQFAEPLADRLTDESPALSHRLLKLVEVSLVKEASMATGRGEALRVQPEIERVRKKLERVTSESPHS